MNLLKFVSENYVNILLALAAIVAAAEAVVRVTPTEKDDGAIERVGKAIKFVMNALKIPNNLK